ncbi:MAG: helix-hairpin-helix domain-containing protein [Streptosporangiales bacterium]
MAKSVAARPRREKRRDGRLSGRLSRLAWASVPVWSLSLLSYVPFLRLAVARRRNRDWAVFAGCLAAVVFEICCASTRLGGAGPVLAGLTATLLIVVAPVHAFVALHPDADLVQAEPCAVEDARDRIRRRTSAREIAQADPLLARELRIGRPDLPREYDDGGLVDINHVPGEILTSRLGLTLGETAAIVAAREELGRFVSPEELSLYGQLAPDRVDDLRDWMLFV